MNNQMRIALTGGRQCFILEQIRKGGFVMEPLDNNELTNEEFVRQLLKQNPNAAVVNPALFEPNRKQSKKLNKNKTKKED